MKYLLQKSVYIVLILTFFGACAEKDPCEDVICGDNGRCIDGNCVCEEYWGGDICNTYFLSQYEGSYLGTQTIQGSIFPITCNADNIFGNGRMLVDGDGAENSHFAFTIDVDTDGNFIIEDNIQSSFGIFGNSSYDVVFDSIRGVGRFDGIKMEGTANYYMFYGDVWTTTFELYRQ